MVINVLSSHRFHLLDLARELHALGHDVRYYSYVPSRRCAQFGIPPQICSCFLWLVWPFFLLERLLPVRCQKHIIWYRDSLMDWYLAKTMRPCDVLVVMGYVYHDSMLEARRRWHALTILEWGSKHITEQLRLIHREHEYLPRQLARDLHNYEICDYVSVPARHAFDSFVQQGVPAHKIVVNPYGVDLSQFHPTICTGEYDLIFVGGWRTEKGCDLIVELCRQYHYRFLHVGALVNMAFPAEDNMTHVEPVDQKDLIQYYARAKVFVIPSRAEGLAMVQAQAIACGLPVVCSRETGGVDLLAAFAGQRWVIEMPELTVEALHYGVERALQLASTQQGRRNYAGADLDNLSWAAYGQRYHTWLTALGHSDNP